LADEFAAYRGQHVCIADRGFLAVPRSVAAALVEVCFRVAVNGVPGDGDCLGEERERNGPPDGLFDAVAGVADAVGLRS
jgi:hypothetical protein